jgi:hypothetical protein
MNQIDHAQVITAMVNAILHLPAKNDEEFKDLVVRATYEAILAAQRSRLGDIANRPPAQ